ncbi:MAG: response regulator transcription factor [Chloroflexi bacterium]|nr:response regulator transcription factor [Chloroflexota bacterium]MDA1220332.1 response regulator transcription factor [Chloroflexota bacterium]
MLHNKACVLVVEDDPRILRLEQMVLEKEGYTVLTSLTAEEALETLAEISPSLIVLDVGLPGMDGFAACYQIREVSQVPIIMVTGRDFNEDKIKGLEIGADDYITKPFSPNELAARVKAALRRSAMSTGVIEPTVQIGDLFVDFISNRVMLANREVLLSDTEYRLLCYLARNAGRIVTRDQILERIWGEEYSGEDHLLHVTIGRLRLKLEDPARKPKYIITRRGIGYSFPIEDEYVGYGSRLA